MDKELIQGLARKVGWDFAGMGDIPHTIAINQLAKFTALVAEECWKEVQTLIKPGDVGGNGCDNTAQRNGYILAAQVIRAKFPMPEVKL